MKLIDEQNKELQKKKNQQTEFYKKFLKETNQKNLEKVEQKEEVKRAEELQNNLKKYQQQKDELADFNKGRKHKQMEEAKKLTSQNTIS